MRDTATEVVALGGWMQLVLGLIDSEQNLKSGIDQLERSVTERVPPGTALHLDHRWVAADGGCLLMVWTGASTTLADVATSESAATVAVGHWSQRPDRLEEALHLGSGAGTISLVGASETGLWARTSLSGVEPLYVARGRRRLAVSNRATVAAVAAHGELGFDLESLPQYISAGFALSDRTPFDRVAALPRAALLHVHRRRFGRALVETQRRELPSDEAFRVPEQAGAELAEALVGAMAPLHRGGEPLELGLTGGKDSRLLAAALRAADIPFTAQTFGPDGHPDVIVGRGIAQMLGVPHTHNRPRVTVGSEGRSVLEADPLDRAINAVLLGEGMISSYENLGRAGGPYRAQAVLSGVGGGLLRGGYAHYATDLSPEGAQQHLTKGFLRYLPLMQTDAQQQLRCLLQPWLDRAAHEPAHTLDEFYREYRVGRWASAARSAYLVTRNLVQPLFDSRVVDISVRADVDERLSELLIYRALNHLSGRLARHPFAVHRWIFEKDGPHTTLPDWADREPVPPGPSMEASFNWRVHYGPEVQAVFAEVVLDRERDHDLFQIMRRAAVETLLTADPPRSQHLSWHLFTIAVLLSRIWERPSPPTSPVRVTVPSAG